MTASPVTTTEHTQSLVRQLKLLVIVLIFSNIALGTFGFFFLRNIDRKYSALIEQSIPTLHALQNLTVKASQAMRSTNPDLLADSKTTPAEIAKRAHAAIEQEVELREQILERDWIPNAHQERANVRNSGLAFEHTAAEMIPLLEANQAAEADKFRESKLRPVYNRYVSATTEAAELLQSASMNTRNNLSIRSGNLSKVMLGLASWPIMILGTFLLFTALFVITVLIRVTLFREEHA